MSSSTQLSYIMPGFNKELVKGTLNVTASIGALFAPWESVRIIGAANLIGCSYIFVNNIIGAYQCPQTWTNSCGKKQHFRISNGLKYRLIRTMNPVVTALAWTFPNTFVLTVPSILVGCIARIPSKYLPITFTAKQLAPIFTIAAVISFAFCSLRGYQVKQSTAKCTDDSVEIVRAGVNTRNKLGYKCAVVVPAILVLGILAMRTGQIFRG